MKFTEQIAANTWCMLRDVRKWEEVSLGEETLTELLILKFKRCMSENRYKLFQIKKNKESEIGADLEVRIHAGHNRARIFAIQAKKLYRSGIYEKLRDKVGPSNHRRFQIDVLERYSCDEGAIPYYLLYNYVDDGTQLPWHCCKCPPSEKQLGCTLVPSWNIRQAAFIIPRSKHKNFRSIHKSPDALPWRCLFDCRNHQLLAAARHSLSMFRGVIPTNTEKQPLIG